MGYRQVSREWIFVRVGVEDGDTNVQKPQNNQHVALLTHLTFENTTRVLLRTGSM